MLETLTTEKFQQLISKWISTDEIRLKLRHNHMLSKEDLEEEGYNEKEIREELDRVAESFSLQKGISITDLEVHIWKCWTDPLQWEEVEKVSLENEKRTTYLSKFDWNLKKEVPHFCEDFAGNSDNNLVNYYFNNPDLANKCLLRTFYPTNDLAENYRLEVVTTPEDDKIIGWVIIVD